MGGFVLHVSKLGNEGCPIDPTSPVPPPWDNDSPAAGASAMQGGLPTVEVGSFIAKWMRHPGFIVYDEVFRVAPNEAWFDSSRSPSSPTQFEIANVNVEPGQSLLVVDYECRPYRFSGVGNYDYAPLEDGRLGGSMGFAVTLNGQTPGNLRYRLDPVSSTIRRQAFQNSKPMLLSAAQQTADDYEISAAQSYGSAAGFASALMPQSPQKFGPRVAPMLMFVDDNTQLVFTGVVFRPIDIAIPFVQARVMGYKCPSVVANQILRDLQSTLR